MARKNSGLVGADGAPVSQPAQAPVAPAGARRPNPAHSKYPQTIDYGPALVRVTAAGSGDSVFVRTSEILALEINSETSRCQLVIKNGSVLPITDEPEVVIARMGGEA